MPNRQQSSPKIARLERAAALEGCRSLVKRSRLESGESLTGHKGSNPLPSATVHIADMKIRTNPETDEAEVQVDDDQWVNIEEAMVEAEKNNQSLRTYLLETYKKVVE